VPDAVKNEFVNIGVVLWEADGGFADVRFTHDWRRVRCLDADADVDTLAAMEESIRAQLRGADRQKLMRLVGESLSTGVQASSATACLAEDPALEIEQLAKMYLESVRRERGRELAARQAILAEMRGAFERAGVWGLMKKRIAVEQYTRKGDPLKLDCGYRPNGVIKLFHAVSLASDIDAAKVLAFSFPLIAAGMERVDKAKAELTAVIEPDLDRGRDEVAFALETLERSRIAVASSAELPAIAERARVELKI
jgi:hypothetical protein